MKYWIHKSPKHRKKSLLPILNLSTFIQCPAACEQLGTGWESKRELQWHRNHEAGLESRAASELHGTRIPSPAEKRNLLYLKTFESSDELKLELQPNTSLAQF